MDTFLRISKKLKWILFTKRTKEIPKIIRNSSAYHLIFQKFMVGQSVSQPVSRSVGRSVRPSTSQSVSQSVRQAASQPASQPVSRSVKKSLLVQFFIFKTVRCVWVKWFCSNTLLLFCSAWDILSSENILYVNT